CGKNIENIKVMLKKYSLGVAPTIRPIEYDDIPLITVFLHMENQVFVLCQDDAIGIFFYLTDFRYFPRAYAIKFPVKRRDRGQLVCLCRGVTTEAPLIPSFFATIKSRRFLEAKYVIVLKSGVGEMLGSRVVEIKVIYFLIGISRSGAIN